MGSWQERLNSFNKQQEKCQATLRTIAGSKTSNKTMTPAPRITPASTLVKSPLPEVKFSSDTERLQRINNVRKSYVGTQIKRVIDRLFEALKAGHQIWLLSTMGSQEDIAYPNDPIASIKVYSELKELFESIELPRDMLDIERDLQKNGMKPATNTARRRVMAENCYSLSKPKRKKKKKRTEISKRTNLTNAHLPELFSKP